MPLDGATYSRVDEFHALRNQMADYLEAHGWCQGELKSRGASCLVGSYLRVTRGPRFSVDRFEMRVMDKRLEALLRSLGFEHVHSPLDRLYWSGPVDAAVKWNDDGERTKEQVIFLLRFGLRR